MHCNAFGWIIGGRNVDEKICLPKLRKVATFPLAPPCPAPRGEFAFTCTHCASVLTYDDAHVPLGTALWGTKLRSIFTFLGGMVILSAIELIGGRVAALATIAILGMIYGAIYLLSSKPAYKVLDREHP